MDATGQRQSKYAGQGLGDRASTGSDDLVANFIAVSAESFAVLGGAHFASHQNVELVSNASKP
jgi:hypothetical protein